MCQRPSDFFQINTPFGNYIETECFAILTKEQAQIMRALGRKNVGMDMLLTSLSRPGENVAPNVPSAHALGLAIDSVHENPAYMLQTFLQLYQWWPGGLGLSIAPGCQHIHIDARKRRAVWLETSCPVRVGNVVSVAQVVDGPGAAHLRFLETLKNAVARFPNNGKRSAAAQVSQMFREITDVFLDQLLYVAGRTTDGLSKIAAPHLPGWGAVLFTLGGAYVATQLGKAYLFKKRN